MQYEPHWESIDARPIPSWFDEAKFGIFIHWGLYSVPASAKKGTYAEWYWNALVRGDEETVAFHNRVYGKDFPYQDFVPLFRAEFFHPDRWAHLFAKAGARYVALTSKHHDGFCLWPSPHSWNWNSADVGPHRDLLGELTDAVRAKGLKMGFYYSLYEWYHPLYLEDPRRYALEHMIPQLKEVVERYRPSILYTDGEWDHPSEVWRSTEFLAWLLNESSVRDEIVINDRWGKETRSAHGGYYSTEYGEVGGGKTLTEDRKWEEIRGIGASFGFNRNEELADYLTARQLIHLLVSSAARGGNLFLNVGPTADGRIPVIQEERLLQMGDWLKVNGEAIYGTKPWRVPNEGEAVWYTAKGKSIYAICTKWPGRELVLSEPKPRSGAVVQLLGREGQLLWKHEGGKMRINLPQLSPEELPSCHAYAFRMKGIR
jgi:alpha-L-fucosidase